MASFTASERRVDEAVRDLHDYLWTGARHDEAKLLRRIERSAEDLDRHLGTRGAVFRAVRPLTRDFRRATSGPDLFTFLRAVANLSAAADRAHRKPTDAAKHASQLAVSLCVHLASIADRRDLVDEFESGQTDFAEFTSKLADALEERGVLRAGEFRRAVNQAFDVKALFDPDAPRDAQQIMAAAAVTAVGFACVLFVDALRALGRYREAPYAELVPVTRRILDGLGGHP